MTTPTDINIQRYTEIIQQGRERLAMWQAEVEKVKSPEWKTYYTRCVNEAQRGVDYTAQWFTQNGLPIPGSPEA